MLEIPSVLLRRKSNLLYATSSSPGTVVNVQGNPKRVALVIAQGSGATFTFDGVPITFSSTASLPAGLRIIDRYNVGDFVTKPFTISPTAANPYLVYEVVDDQIPSE